MKFSLRRPRSPLMIALFLSFVLLAGLFMGWFSGGDVFRSGCCWRRGAGRIFYFQGGHETFPVYYQKEVQQVIKNAIRWAAPRKCEVELNTARHCKVTPNELAGI